MANNKLNFDKKMECRICDELNEKNSNYESRMTLRLSRWLEVAELLAGKTATGKENAKISPTFIKYSKSFFVRFSIPTKVSIFSREEKLLFPLVFTIFSITLIPTPLIPDKP